MRPTSSFVLILAAAASLVLGNLARGESITVQLVSGPVVNGSFFNYTYDAQLVGDVFGGTSSITSGQNDLFTIVDFGGMNSTTIAATTASTPVNWTFSTPNQQALNVGLFAFDSATVADATFTYTGPTMSVAFGGHQDLGDFTVESTVSTPTPLHFYGANDFETDSNGSSAASNQGLVLAPGAGGPSVLPIPTAAFGGPLLFGLVGMRGLFVAYRRRALL